MGYFASELEIQRHPGLLRYAIISKEATTEKVVPFLKQSENENHPSSLPSLERTC